MSTTEKWEGVDEGRYSNPWSKSSLQADGLNNNPEDNFNKNRVRCPNCKKVVAPKLGNSGMDMKPVTCPECKAKLPDVNVYETQKKLTEGGMGRLSLYANAQSHLEEAMAIAKDAEGQQLYIRDRVVQKTIDPKTNKYVWSKPSLDNLYRVEKIESPDAIVTIEIETKRKVRVKPSDVKRIGKPHIFEYGAVLKAKFDDTIIVRETQAQSLNEAARFLGMTFPAYEVAKIFEIGTTNLTCSSCGERTTGKQWHNRDTGYGLCPKCVKTIKARSDYSDEQMKSDYGVEGINYNVKE
jgi:predicted amidophosphoribosyltransferase